MNLRDLERRLDAIGRGSRTKVASALGIDASTLTKILNGKRKLQLGEPDVIEETLRALESGSEPGRHAPTGLVPVFGFAAAAGELVGLEQQHVIRHISRHPAQDGYGHVGAVEVIGESMHPRYKPREVAYFIFGMRPRRGDDVIAELADHQGIIKEFVMEKDGQVFLKEYYPEERQLTFPATSVRALHAVVGRG